MEWEDGTHTLLKMSNGGVGIVTMTKLDATVALSAAVRRADFICMVACVWKW